VLADLLGDRGGVGMGLVHGGFDSRGGLEVFSLNVSKALVGCRMTAIHAKAFGGDGVIRCDDREADRSRR
jgi:hypothetical protein